METVLIHADAICSVKAVYYHGEFLYTATYFYDEEGNVKNTIRVYASGIVEEL